MNLRSTLLAATILALPMAANAQPINGIYVGAGVGYNLMQDQNWSAGGMSGHADMNGGFVGVLSVGYGFGNGLRAELEGDYRNNGFHSLSTGGGTFSAGGTEQKYGPMINVLYDFNNLTPYVVPYVGVGGGYQWAQQNFHAAGPGFSVASNETKGALAYQGIVGAALPITGVPGLAVTAEYRFMGLEGNRNYSGTGTIGGKTGSGTMTLGDEYNHSFLLGVRYAFGVAPAAAAVVQTQTIAQAPAPAPARSYLVFFDWDRADLSARAKQIIGDAADNSRKVSYTKLEVNGYADTSGTPTYNKGLSVRRGQAVAAELVKDGVPRAAITITGYGDTNLLVPTGPGVREPQNRRVEIIIR
jgi:OOP family OmpA-OmpF porin